MLHRIPLTLVVVVLALAPAQAVSAQTYSAHKARRQFITISYDWLTTEPYRFARHPLTDLVGREVVPAQFETYDYRTRDGSVLVNVLEFRKRSRGAGVTVYPLGANVGAALGIRGSYEDLPAIRIAFSGEGAPANYELVGARAYDVSAGLYMMDHATGWGLGSHAFIAGGIGRIKAGARDGDRYFAEGGGGMNSGPIGVELSVKFAVNHLADPVGHRFITIPVILRATVSF